ncbi:NAD(P)/FAD-dependent oxidoreductase [Terribacillus sp. DMT04]|uniref:NAD(P)/FAD-dependent oxidoreductase n=1 Tax=Terribacillus sp. DMT04 TaxID=2850441 RepID=UPI001C2C418F|nr:NAD(P)/FAD-dependent oxidoreductase [Terribacillus sp. DMT04]QXE00786.1 NAD(P)/FAD-dependent oxidoreductase [Terribacillus sp. DMT04]
MNKPKIVIAGAGYGGLITTVKLQKLIGTEEASITLINKHDYHYQTTWLHENAAGTRHHDQTRIAIKDVIDPRKVNFVQDTVTKIDPDAKKVTMENGEISYDYLVIGLGFEPANFGIEGLLDHAYNIRSINSSRLIREHIEHNFAMYNNESEKKEERLNIVIGGGGFTGIEFAGELAERIPELCKEYDIDRDKVRVTVIEAGPSVMMGFDPQLVEYALNSLESRGISFQTNAFLKEVAADSIVYEKADEKHTIKTNTTVWAAGVQGSSVLEKSGFDVKRNKVMVTEDLRDPNYEDIFIVGDCAAVMNEETGKPYPPTAQIATQMGFNCAQNLKALIRKESNTQKFVPDLKGTLASLGGGDAMGTVMGKKLYGKPADVMKKASDNRYLYQLGGVGLVLKKGKFNIFS